MRFRGTGFQIFYLTDTMLLVDVLVLQMAIFSRPECRDSYHYRSIIVTDDV